MKLGGASYEEIHAAGGGIHFTTGKTQEASEDKLLASFKDRLQSMIRYGTTTVECKSGYGLDTENELKMLRVLERARMEVPIEISSTFCGAHAVPKYDDNFQTSDLCSLMKTSINWFLKWRNIVFSKK